MTVQAHEEQAPEVAVRGTRNYDPRSRMTRVKGQWYLEVKHRLAWFRAEFPDGRIETTIHSISPQCAVITARAEIVDEHGNVRGVGSGVGSCRSDEFDAYIEKAETKAIGRALASLGFGTQFSLEYDDGTDGSLSTLADAPVSAATPRAQNGQGYPSNGPTPIRSHGSQEASNRLQVGGGDGGGVNYPLASDPQRRMIGARTREANLTDADVAAYVERTFNVTMDRLGRRDASKLIDALGAGQVPTSGSGPGGRHGAEEPAAQGYGAGSVGDVPF